MNTQVSPLHICPRCRCETSLSVQNYPVHKNQSLQLIKCYYCNLQWKQIWTIALEKEEPMDRNITSQYYGNYDDG
jgi:transcription elongation factor Elf1